MTADHLDPTTLRALAKRVEAGESGREIDLQVCVVLGARVTREIQPVTGVHSLERFWSWADGEAIGWSLPPLTTSLDAVEALRVRLLPSSVLSVFSWNDGFGTSLLRPGGDRKAVHVFAPTETAARLAALLYAVAAKVEGERADA